ncbi:hypothetical protein AC1031_009625 [Aphanomyces cochlioides]|nr:hypothetical protein AC1031_009625 [Aphanomyces cochlioides]
MLDQVMPRQDKEAHDSEHVEPSFGKFACSHDIALLRQVVHEKPWEADHGFVMEKWSRIADDLNRRQEFDMPLKRFQLDETRSKRKSGTTEEYNERDQVLTDIKSRMDDHATQTATLKERAKRKAEGIENSGLLMRQMAMKEIIQGDSNNKQRVKPSLSDANALLDTIQRGIQQKQENEAKLVQLMQDRLEFDREQATRQAEQHAAMQEMILALLQRQPN